jgi:hypothetical protein
MRRCRSAKLDAYGDLTARSRARWRHAVDESADDIAPLWDVDGARLAAGMTQRRRSTVWPREAKASALGGGRCKADGQLWHQMPVIMLRLAR